MGTNVRTSMIQRLDCLSGVSIEDLNGPGCTSNEQGITLINKQNGNWNIVVDAKRHGTTEGAIWDIIPVQSVIEIGHDDDFLIERNCRARARKISARVNRRRAHAHILHVLGVICHLSSIEWTSQHLRMAFISGRFGWLGNGPGESYTIPWSTYDTASNFPPSRK